MPIKINTYYYLSFFFISFSVSVSYIIINISLLSFWLIYNRIISGINTIELNIIIINYDHLSEQIILIIIFISTIIFFPFFILYFFLIFICSIEKQYIFHWSYCIYCILYFFVLSLIFNHYDFAYSAFIDVYIPDLVQKCVDFSTFFIQYKGYFYDFIFIIFFFISLRFNFIIWPYKYYNYLYTNTIKYNFTLIIIIRFFSSFFILYYFGSYSIYINGLILCISLRCLEFIIIIMRIFILLQRLQNKA